MTSRASAEPKSLRLVLGGPAGWAGGAGAQTAKPGFYQIAENWDGRFGVPGPREVADLTGIAAGFRVVQMLTHADTQVCITTNSTDTKVYRKETTWVEKANIAARVATGDGCAVSFKNVLAIAFGSGNPYQFTTGTGAGAWTFTASTKTSNNAKSANWFLKQTNGLLTPRVIYCTNPNEVYYTEDLSNTDGAGVNATYIEDTSTTQMYFNCIVEEPRSGRVLFGMRHALFTLHQEPGYEGIAEKLTEDFPDPMADAGGQSDRKNFEGPVKVGGRLYFPVEGYDILEWDGSGQYNRYMAPRWVNRNLPRLSLPVNCLVSAGGYLVAFLGSKNTATLKAVTYAPGGNSRTANVFTTSSEMWVGSYVGGNFVWHGILLLCANPLRYAWFDQTDSYLYLASGDSMAVNVQMTRCLFYTDNPQDHPTSSVITLNTGTWKMEPGGIDFGDNWLAKRPDYLRLHTIGLTAIATLQVQYDVNPDYDSTAYDSNFVTFTANEDAALGQAFPDEQIFRTLQLRFLGTGDASNNVYAILRGLELRASYAPEYDQEMRAR